MRKLNSLQQLAGEYGLSVRLIGEDGGSYALVSRLTDGANAEQ